MYNEGLCQMNERLLGIRDSTNSTVRVRRGRFTKINKLEFDCEECNKRCDGTIHCDECNRFYCRKKCRDHHECSRKGD